MITGALMNLMSCTDRIDKALNAPSDEIYQDIWGKTRHLYRQVALLGSSHATSVDSAPEKLQPPAAALARLMLWCWCVCVRWLL
jgi:hypothetical protein